MATIQFPAAYGSGLDDSWQLILSYAFQNNLIFGRDLYFTYGPLGFLENHVQLAELFWIQLGWQLLTRLAAIGLIVFWVRTIPTWLQGAVFVGMLMLTTSPISLALPMNDSLFMVIIWVAGAGLIVQGEKSLKIVAISLGLLAAFALVKTSLTVAATSTVGIAVVFHGSHRRYQVAALLVFGYVGCWLLGWSLAGQPFGALVPFFRSAAEIVGGYGEGMVISTRFLRLVAAALTALTFSGLICLRVWQSRGDFQVIALGIMTGGLLLMSYRLATCRADAVHLSGLFVWTGIISLLWLAITPTNSKPLKAGQNFAPHVVFAAGAMIICGYHFGSDKPGRLLENLTTAVRLCISPHHYFKDWQQWARDSGAEMRLTSVRAVVGDAELDVHGHYQSRAIRGGYHYISRPIPQSYSAYTPLLARINGDWMADKRPPFTLMKVESIDERLPALEDSRALVYSLQNYKVSVEEQGFLLLALKPAPTAIRTYPAGPSARFCMGDSQTFQIPSGDPICYITVEATFSVAGQIAAHFFPIRPLTIEMKFATGKTECYFLPLRMGQAGFVIYPFIRDNSDVVRWISHRTSDLVSEFRIYAPRNGWAYQDTVRVNFSAIGPAN
ncbi:MAG: hypothetical protein ABIV50_16090, partial [Opitutus sp.]